MKSFIVALVMICTIVLLHAYLPDAALVRFTNKSKEDFLQVTGRIGGKEFMFNDLKAGKSSPYVQIGKTFLTGYFKVITATDTLEYSPTTEEIMKQEEYDKGRFIIDLNIEVKDGKKTLTVKGFKK
jgi:uncharacterized protein (DUF1684 family)